MAKIEFGSIMEDVVTRDEFPMDRVLDVLGDATIAVLGYGVQGPAQALNLHDNGLTVIVGQRQGSPTWDKACGDGWIPGETLFSIEEAAARGSVVLYLLSDAAQAELWPVVRRALQPGNALCFAHGFALVYGDQTGVVPPEDVDVLLVAPKGSGRTVRDNFLAGMGINSSFAVAQDATGTAHDRAVALGMGIGSGYLFPTSFEREVWSDLVGERGVLMGALAGVIEAQYGLLREHGHSPSEAFNETVEELTQSLIRLVGENGMDWMFANTSTTAQRGALDWRRRFREATMPVFEELYERVRSGEETRIVLDANSNSDYRRRLEAELAEMRESELWQAGAAVRALRPERAVPEPGKAA